MTPQQQAVIEQIAREANARGETLTVEYRDGKRVVYPAPGR